MPLNAHKMLLIYEKSRISFKTYNLSIFSFWIMITCIYTFILKKKCIKCMVLMHEIACYHSHSVISSSSINGYD